MATYEEIYGKRVKEFDSDPTLESSYEGQVWYDKSSGVLKSVVTFAAWSSTSVMNNALARSQGAGTTSAGLSMGGQDQPGTKLTVTEEYNGSGWSLGGSMPAAKADHAGAGTQTAAYAAGGSPYLNSAYNYDGTSWSGIPNIGTARQKFAGCGTTTASLVFGAQVPGSPPQGGQTEEYNGSSWSEQNDLGTARAKLTGCGTQTAGLGFGGYQPTIPSQPKQKAQTEQYDGTSWSEVADLITAVNAAGGAGTQTAALCFGGYNGTASITTTQDWDGTSWTTSPATLGTAVNSNGGAGTNTSALSMAGYAPSATSNVEEYNVSINTITAAAWSSTPAVNTGRSLLAGGGTATAGLIFGGQTSNPTKVNNSEEWDGTSWTEGSDLATARGNGIGGCGTQTAGLAFCGDVYPTSPRNTADTEEYDGSSWSEANDANTARRGTAGAGTQTAAVMAGGYTTTNISSTEEYDGTNWSNVNSMPYSRANITIAGTQTAAILAAGSPASPTATLEYDGTNWTATAAYPAMPVYSVGSSGIQTAALFFSGFSPPPVLATTVGYDGTSFSSRPSMGTARYGVGPTSAGPSTSTIAAAGGGYPSPAAYTISEEFTGETETVTFKTLTTS